MHESALLALVLLLITTAASAASAEQAGSSAAIVFERNGDLFVISLDGSRTVRLTNTPVWHENDPAASPDGRSIVYARRRGLNGNTSAIWTTSSDGRRQARLTSRFDLTPAWSRDGQTIYFSRLLTQIDKGPDFSLNEQCGSIFRMDADGSDLRRLTNPPWKDSFHSHYEPSVSPGGSRIAFTDANQCSGGTTSYALRVIDRNGRVTEDLARLPGNAYYPVPPEYESPSWSPDGAWIVFLGDRRVYVAHRDGTQRRPVTPGRFLATDVSWSPNGEWVAFTGGAAKGFPDADLWIVRPDGTSLRRLTRTKANEASPTWLPTLPAG